MELRPSNQIRQEKHFPSSISLRGSLIHCQCGRQYVGCTTQELHNRVNKHRMNVHKKFMLHGLSRHCTLEFPEDNYHISITLIDRVKVLHQIDLETLKRSEVFWIYTLKTLQPTANIYVYSWDVPHSQRNSKKSLALSGTTNRIKENNISLHIISTHYHPQALKSPEP